MPSGVDMKEQINLGTGDPDVEAPRNVVEAAVEALREGGRWTHYSHIRKNITQDNFLEAVVDYYKGLGPTYELEQVIPTAGSGAALSIAMATLLEKGDEILMFEPAFMGYFRPLKELGVKPVFAPLSEDRGFHPDTETLGEYVTSKTKAILLCSPNNPTGTVLTPGETQGIADLAIEHDLNVIADEIYLHYIYDDNVFTSISGLEGMKERTINVMSFSKTFSMTGWRLGYALVPERHLGKAKEKAGFINAMPATFVHAAGAVALREGWDYVDKLREEYLNRRNYFCDAADGINGLSCQRAEGGFYAWVKTAGTGLDSQKFVERLAEKEKLTLTPGHLFGGKSDDYVRVALVRPVPVLEKAVERLRGFVESL
jgi:aminotransferase